MNGRLTLLLLFVCVIAIIAGLFLGPVSLTPLDVVKGILGQSDPITVTIIHDIRLPRVLAAWFAGAALGASGAALQGLLRNPLADPGILGVSSTASLGAVITLYFNLTIIGYWVMPVGAILGALVATFILFVLGAGRVTTTRLILIGVGLSSFGGALITLVMNLAPNPFALSDLVNWLFGTVSNRSFNDLFLTVPFMMAGFVVLLFIKNNLAALSLGEKTAESLGVDMKLTQRFVIAGSGLLTGASVALAGAIGFVGIVSPHLVRPFVGHDPSKVIIPSALLAGALLVVADIIVRLLPFSQELKLGIIAALVGAPGFIYIAIQSKKMG